MRWILLLFATALVFAQERQLTRSARNHALDNNDNFSADDRLLCFDTRGSGQAIGTVDVASGEERIVYAAETTLMAPSFHPLRNEIVFIHGPLSGTYSKSNRRGAVVDLRGNVRFLDIRDAESPVTPPGAHRGGTHRHEYSLDGKRVGFTYDDHLLPAFGRTIGMLVNQRFVVLVSVVPEVLAKPGDLVVASFDSWVGAAGLMRAFIGRVKEADGSLRYSLFVADVPADVDVSTPFAGDLSRFPAPPGGVKIRRLTNWEVSGIVRGSRDGKWIAYLSWAEGGTKQVFVIAASGGTGRQVTRVSGGVQGNVRRHPSGKFVAVSTGQGIVVVEVSSKQTVSLTRLGGDAIVWSNNGTLLAFNRKVDGYQQIFVVPFRGVR